MEFSAKQIAEFIQGTIVGDENATVHTFAKIEEGIPGAISFLSNPKYTHYIYDTQSSIVLVNNDFEPEKEVKATLIKVNNAYESLAKLLNLYEMSKPKKTGIDPLAYIAPIGYSILKERYILLGSTLPRMATSSSSAPPKNVNKTKISTLKIANTAHTP